MIDDFAASLLQGNYKAAEELCKSMDDTSVKNLILNVAYDTENICTYSFTEYMIRQTGNVCWMELAIELMLNPLCFVEGAYSAALFHARELLAMEKSVENLERVLFFYNIPEKLIEEEEAILISREILKLEPDNKIALNI